MSLILRYNDDDFLNKISELNDVKLEMSSEIENIARNIIDSVKKDGDAAVVELTNKFDGTNISDSKQLMLPKSAWDEAYDKCSIETINALHKAADRVRDYHIKQLPQDLIYNDTDGVELGNIWKAINIAGIYVPGGLASYPSSVLMNAIPAKIAGVDKVVMVVPTPNGEINPLVLAAAKISCVDEIYTVGGAQAIAALAYGTKTIPKVDVIVGPGNAYVAAAKRLVFGNVGIDMIAGPSEILVVADNNNNPEWIAADLLSQAEHDVAARSVLITDDESFANKVVASLESILQKLERKEIAEKSWNNNGLVVIVNKLDDAIGLINEIAPEHLELAIDSPKDWISRINNAGAIFMGRYTPEAIGDYIAGPSHVLPTSGTAKFSSGLSVFTFLKRISLIGCDKNSFDKISKETISLAEEEGLGAHSLSVKVRDNNSH